MISTSSKSYPRWEMTGSVIGNKLLDKLKYRISLFAADYSHRLNLMAEIVIKIILYELSNGGM